MTFGIQTLVGGLQETASQAFLVYTLGPVSEKINITRARVHVSTVCFSNLGKLNLLMVVQFYAQANFSLLTQLPQKINLASKVVKSDSNIIILPLKSKSVKLTELVQQRLQ